MTDCNCNYDCIPTITIPTATCAPGATGATGANGGVVLYNDSLLSPSESYIQTDGSYQDFVGVKEYSVPLSQLSVGDRLKVDCQYYGTGFQEEWPKSGIGVQILFNGQNASIFEVYATRGSIFMKTETTIDVIGATGTTLNLRSYSRCFYTLTTPHAGQLAPSGILISSSVMTVDYATTPAKTLKTQGAIMTTPDQTTIYWRCNQFCVEYLKKI